MSHSCVCGGENENCRYCGGSGIIADVLGSALDETVRRLAIENSPTEDIKASPRPWWFPSNISAYVAAPQTTLEAACFFTAPRTPPSNPKPEEVNFESCPLCGAKLKAGRIQRHMSKAHRTTTSNPLFGELVRKAERDRRSGAGTIPVHPDAQASRSERTLCPVCNATVNVSRLKKHMARVHNGRLTPPATQAASDKDPTRQNTTLVAPRDKNLDATKLYAHAYREQGRYGSHRPNSARRETQQGWKTEAA
jgi:hypothetical protein